MKQIVFILVSFVFLSGQNNESSQLINRIIEKIYQNNFAEAQLIADQLTQTDWGFGQLYQLTIMHVRNQDDETIDQQRIDAFNTAISTYIAQMEHRADSLQTAENLFLLGNAYFLKASEENRLKNYYSAFRLSSSGREYLEKALELDPNWSDIKLSLGLYMYWKSVKAGDMFFISIFFADEREEGLAYIQDAIRNGRISELSGKHQLISVLIQENRTDEALKLANELIARYPHSRPILWALGECQRKTGNWTDALTTYQELLDYYLREENHYNSCQVLHKMALCQSALGNKAEMSALMRQFRKIPISEANFARLEKRLAEMNELSKSIGD
ncbi:MAG: bacterial transcriptional activator domain-containing protein [Calditrichaeota bacterium]|nr:bacterial transcriptional activator domain-containing protein [Calditrichota bacterium]